MATKRGSLNEAEEIVGLLRKLLIVQLGIAGVGQAQIRQIVGCGMNDVNGIVKYLRAGKRQDK